ncbi:sufE-like protein 2, chloroplastic [Euphorbia lathyris]|uniref:sufE-like protein 2, chloroplastic n=1 Tax=Euphorbia lathyris TaxID=212925 RepID=UPI00331366EA
MTSFTLKVPPFSPFLKLSNSSNFDPKQTRNSNCHFSSRQTPVLILNSSIKKRGNLNFSVSSYASTDSTAIGDRLFRLVAEFESLKEPIDRVKRLLDYAARLPPFDESARLPGNRVLGCTTQVWLEATIEDNGRMRFRADSDSEITKGFISCLIWLLDGSEPDEVLAVVAEDLGAMNVGLYGKAQSRVNTWHNVLTGMQNRTKALIGEPKRKSPVEALPSLILAADGLGAKGNFSQSQISRIMVSNVGMGDQRSLHNK